MAANRRWAEQHHRLAAVVWQQFPKEWEATSSQLTLHLWSTRAGEFTLAPRGSTAFRPGWGKIPPRPAKDRRTAIRWNFFSITPTSKRSTAGAADGLGVNKHHEFWLHFGSANRQREGAEYARLAA